MKFPPLLLAVILLAPLVHADPSATNASASGTGPVVTTGTPVPPAPSQPASIPGATAPRALPVKPGMPPATVTPASAGEPAVPRATAAETKTGEAAPEVPAPAPGQPGQPTERGRAPAIEAYATPAPSGGYPMTYNSVRTGRRVVALTFDDGPHPQLTPKLLDILKAHNAKATFFVIGRNAAEYPDIMKRIVAEGHEVGNHSWSHPALPRLSRARLDDEISRTTKIIEQTTGRPVTIMRPPYGAINASVRQALTRDHKLNVIMWSVDPLDWKYRNAGRVTQQLVSGAHPGGILLAHDIHPSTVQAIPTTLESLKAKGYEFATVSEIIALDEPAAAPTAPAREQPAPTKKKQKKAG